MQQKIKVNSEFGKLREVLLNRYHVQSMPYPITSIFTCNAGNLKIFQKEYLKFVNIFKEHNVKVNFIDKLLIEIFNSKDELKEIFIDKFMKVNLVLEKDKLILKKIWLDMNNEEMIKSIFSGVYKNNSFKFKEIIDDFNIENKEDEIKTKLKIIKRKFNRNYFLSVPMIGSVYTRDPTTFYNSSVSIHKLRKNYRLPEAFVTEFVYKHHLRFKENIKNFYYFDEKAKIEGGDIIIFDKKTLFIGITQMTNLEGVEQLCKNIMNDSNNEFEKIYAISYKKFFSSEWSSGWLHLDTFFSIIDYNTFLIHPYVFENKKEYSIIEFSKNCTTKKIEFSFNELINKLTNNKAKFITIKNESGVTWRDIMYELKCDSFNVFALEPGKVIAYKRNFYTNNALKKAGIKVIELEESELNKRGGGPHCMTMPINRDDV